MNTKIKVYGLDVSKDDKTVLLACDDVNGCSVYTLNLESTQIKKILVGTKKLSFFNPESSPDGKKIVCIGYINGDATDGAVFMANADGTDLKQLTQGHEIIRRAIFSQYDSSIVLYIKANFYGNYSRFASKGMHDMDLYTVNLQNKTTVKISDMKAYSIYSISELDSNYLLIDLPGGDKGGMFFYNKKLKEAKRIVPANDPRKYPSLYDKPKYSKQFGQLAFTAPYQLYIMNLEDKLATSVYRVKPMQSYISAFNFFHNSKKIVFAIAEGGGLYSINFDGSELRKIDFKLE